MNNFLQLLNETIQRGNLRITVKVKDSSVTNGA